MYRAAGDVCSLRRCAVSWTSSVLYRSRFALDLCVYSAAPLTIPQRSVASDPQPRRAWAVRIRRGRRTQGPTCLSAYLSDHVSSSLCRASQPASESAMDGSLGVLTCVLPRIFLQLYNIVSSNPSSLSCLRPSVHLTGAPNSPKICHNAWYALCFPRPLFPPPCVVSYIVPVPTVPVRSYQFPVRADALLLLLLPVSSCLDLFRAER